ncbi:MAG: M16 family metallopeptidase [Phycisphaerae bacterium]
MSRYAIAAVLLMSLCRSSAAQNVAYEKYQLDNGLTVILHEDHNVPAACVNLWYYVASKDEPEGRSGFAHLFEHLMFMGTHRVPGLDFDNTMEAGGGFNNASTSEDRTNYYEMGPSELLPTLLWLEADRLEHLGDAMTQEKLDKQRDVVRNERRQTSENRPYGRADLRVHGLMFPKGHPYHNTVIGSHEDLQAATVEDVKNFFATYYVPSNASMVVAGDFDPQKIKPLIQNLFGSLPRGSDVVHPTAAPVRLSEVKRLTMTDQVQFARTTMVYHSPKRFAPGDGEMDLTAAILSDGISSRLYQRLVYKDKLAVDVSAYQASMLLGSLFYVEVTAQPGVSLDVVEQAIDEELARFVAQGPTAEELERQKSKIEYGMVSQLQSLLGKADQLNAYQFYYGEPNSFKQDLQRYRDATVADVRNWAARVLTPNARLILRVIPELKVPEDNPRDHHPVAAAAGPFEPPLPESFKLSNGIQVYHWVRHELPLVEMRIVIPKGAACDPAGKAGLASLTANMLDEGAGGKDAMAFADALDSLGARFFAFSSLDSTIVTLSSLQRKFAQSLELCADAVLRPRLDDKEWERVHRLHLEGLKRAQDRPTSVARVVAMRGYFGDRHPYGRPVGGTLDSAAAITLDDIRRFHQQLYRPTDSVILLAGDLSVARAKEQLERAFGHWAPSSAAALTPPEFPEPANQALRVAVVDRPGAVQTVVRFTMPGPRYADRNRPVFQLFNTILGGSFTSRLNKNLREDHGYTYGARSSYAMQPDVGYFTASSSVRTDVTGASIAEFLKEFEGIRGGNIAPEEARKARSSQRMRMIRSFAGLGGILSTAGTLVRNNRPFSDLGEELAIISRIGESDLNRIAYDAVPLDHALLVLVGDKKRIMEQWAGLDLPKPIEWSVTGAPINSD